MNEDIQKILLQIFSRLEERKPSSRLNACESFKVLTLVNPTPRVRNIAGRSKLQQLFLSNKSICITLFETFQEFREHGIYRDFNEALEIEAERRGLMVIHYDTVNDHLAKRHERHGFNFMVTGNPSDPCKAKRVYFRNFRRIT